MEGMGTIKTGRFQPAFQGVASLDAPRRLAKGYKWIQLVSQRHGNATRGNLSCCRWQKLIRPDTDYTIAQRTPGQYHYEQVIAAGAGPRPGVQG